MSTSDHSSKTHYYTNRYLLNCCVLISLAHVFLLVQRLTATLAMIFTVLQILLSAKKQCFILWRKLYGTTVWLFKPMALFLVLDHFLPGISFRLSLAYPWPYCHLLGFSTCSIVFVYSTPLSPQHILLSIKSLRLTLPYHPFCHILLPQLPLMYQALLAQLISSRYVSLRLSRTLPFCFSGCLAYFWS